MADGHQAASPGDRSMSLGSDMTFLPRTTASEMSYLPRPPPTMPSPGVPPKLGTPPPTSGSIPNSYDFTGTGADLGSATLLSNPGSIGGGVPSTWRGVPSLGGGPAGPPPPPASASYLFEALDRDHDGFVSRAEWAAAGGAGFEVPPPSAPSTSGVIVGGGIDGLTMDGWRSIQVGSNSHTPTVSRGTTPISSIGSFEGGVIA